MGPLILIFSVLILSSCDKITKVFQEEDLVQRPVASRCGDCHQEIYKQWKESRHAKAWISEEFKRASENYSKEKCLSCHAPYEITVGDKPKVREVNLADGVNCASCHFRDSTKSMHGPYDVFSPPHPSTKDTEYTKAEICSGCHQETYKQWQMVKTDKSCQDCHMQSKEGKLIQKFPFDLFHASKDVHHHGFVVPTPKPEFFRVEAVKNKENLTLYITNLKTPHNVPTADHGNPKYYIDVQYIKDGNVVYSDSQTLTKKESLIHKQTKEVVFPVNVDYDKVKVILSRKLSWEEKPKKIADFEF
ncbi:MAG: multiheme c-type cytochrome [Hydrogenothermaceae bacterium]